MCSDIDIIKEIIYIYIYIYMCVCVCVCVCVMSYDKLYDKLYM